MALYYNLQVYKDVYALVLRLFQYTKDYPKEYKYSLGEDIRRDSVVLVRSIYRANRAYDKTPDLEAFLDDFEVLKFEVRLSKDLHLLSIGHFGEISALMDTVITGIRSISRNASPRIREFFASKLYLSLSPWKVILQRVNFFSFG